MDKKYCHHLKLFAAPQLALLLLSLLLAGFCADAASESNLKKFVKVITKKEGEITRFFVDNLEAGEVTATFTVSADNLKGNVTFPYTSTYPARQVTEAFTLSPVDPKKGWGYSYTNHFTIGNHLAVHDDACTYLLPYAAGAGFRVTRSEE